MGRMSLRTRTIPALLAVLLLATGAQTTGAQAAEHLPRTTVVGIGLGSGTTAITPGVVDRASVNLSATYAITLSLRYDTRAFAVNSAATVTNTSGGPIDRIEFNTIAARLGGGLDLRLVEVDGMAVNGRVDDQTISVPLGRVLAAGATTTVRIRYAAHLRSSLGGSNWLFTKANGIVNAYRWIPWVSRATPFDRPNHGDPFVTPVSPSVKLRIETDRRLVVVSSATRVKMSADGLTQWFEASNVRDVTVTAAPDFRSRSVLVGATRVSYHYRSGTNAGAVLDAAVNAFLKLKARLGPYPYPTFKVVQSAGGYGMESPGLIWIPYGVGRANLRYLVTHETAHQWFYGLVGNDQARQPFADEAAADFVARDVLGLRRASRCGTGLLDRSIYSYSSACYYEIVYIQGGNLLNEARRRMGSKVFWAALRGYVTDNRFRISGTATLLRALDDATPVDLSKLFAPRFPRFY